MEGHYDKIRLLGRGAFGAVYLVKRKSDGLQLAMKIVHIPPALDRALVLKEVTLLQRSFRQCTTLASCATMIRSSRATRWTAIDSTSSLNIWKAGH